MRASPNSRPYCENASNHDPIRLLCMPLINHVKRLAGIASGWDRYVITAAHSLPFIPPCHPASYLQERTYQKLLAPLGGEPAAWAECFFVDPIGDIAVLGSPDSPALCDQAEAYRELVEADSVTPLPIAAPGKEGWLLSLDGDWFRCAIETIGPLGTLWLGDGQRPRGEPLRGSPLQPTPFK